jgi:hypothetical protein
MSSIVRWRRHIKRGQRYSKIRSSHSWPELSFLSWSDWTQTSTDWLPASLKKKHLADLNGLSEDSIFIEHEAGIQIAGTKKFTDFNLEKIKAFYRLKLRSIESRLGQGMPLIVQGIP